LRLLREPLRRARLVDLADVARATGLRPLAINDVDCHPDRRLRQDVVTCIRWHAHPGSNPPPLEGGDEPRLELPEMGLGAHVLEDHAAFVFR
jgi:hypothetical protein